MNDVIGEYEKIQKDTISHVVQSTWKRYCSFEKRLQKTSFNFIFNSFKNRNKQLKVAGRILENCKLMADSAVSFLLDNLSRLLNDELKLLSGVEGKINSLCKELRFINIFLRSSDRKRDKDFVKEVVSQIRDVAFQAEDVIDTYVAKVATHGRRSKVKKFFHWKERLFLLHHVDAEIETIRKRIDEIYKNKEKYGITEGESTSQHAAAAESIRERRRDVEENHVVDLFRDSIKVIKKLKQGDSHCKVVSIIGMGGLGKTTLARKIYNHDEVKELFPIRAWGYVSDEYRPKELWLSLLENLLPRPEYTDENDEKKLKHKVRECLKGEKYLVVLDDIWKVEVWKKIEDVFPDENNGSRILITSREKDVANYAGQGTTSPYYLPLLNEKQSWKLFSSKVFRAGQHCPSDLEPHGKDMAKSCKGLPLAIVVLAGLVAQKERSEREWSRMKDITWRLSKDKNEATDTLKLSYDSLPQRLKPCFLYFGIYPEDYEIDVTDLIHLWIAEGFIEAQEGVEQEDIAEYYLDELVDRSLVQVAFRSFDGSVQRCRIHDLLRDLCISESRSDRFLQVYKEPNNINTPANADSRRLSIHCGVSSSISSNKFKQSCTRSLFFFSQQVEHSEDVLKPFNLARVLYCNFTPRIDWNMMIHLRYLRVEDVHVPDSVQRLWNLEILHLNTVLEISAEIWKLKRLKHLRIVSREDVPRLPDLAKSLANAFPSNLTNITLEIIRSSWSDERELLNIMKSLAKFPNLRSLKITKFYCFGGIRLNFTAGEFPKLKVFHMNIDGIKSWTLEEGAMPCLQNLLIRTINDDLHALPEELWSLTTLKEVHVVNPVRGLADKLEYVKRKNGFKLIISRDRLLTCSPNSASSPDSF